MTVVYIYLKKTFEKNFQYLYYISVHHNKIIQYLMYVFYCTEGSSIIIVATCINIQNSSVKFDGGNIRKPIRACSVKAVSAY